MPFWHKCNTKSKVDCLISLEIGDICDHVEHILRRCSCTINPPLDGLIRDVKFSAQLCDCLILRHIILYRPILVSLLYTCTKKKPLFINAYKSASSRLLKKEFPQIREKLWKEHFWSQSFCLLTTGGAPLDVIKQYIENQGIDRRRKKWNHAKQSIQIEPWDTRG